MEDIQRIKESKPAYLYSTVRPVSDVSEWLECREAISGDTYYWHPLTGRVTWNSPSKDLDNIESKRGADESKADEFHSDIRSVMDKAEERDRKRGMHLQTGGNDHHSARSSVASVILKILNDYNLHAKDEDISSNEEESRAVGLLAAMSRVLDHDAQGGNGSVVEELFVPPLPPDGEDTDIKQDIRAANENADKIDAGWPLDASAVPPHATETTAQPKRECSDMETDASEDERKARTDRWNHRELQKSVEVDNGSRAYAGSEGKPAYLASLDGEEYGVRYNEFNHQNGRHQTSTMELNTADKSAGAYEIGPSHHSSQDEKLVANAPDPNRKRKKRRLRGSKVSKEAEALINKWNAVHEELHDEKRDEDRWKDDGASSDGNVLSGPGESERKTVHTMKDNVRIQGHSALLREEELGEDNTATASNLEPVIGDWRHRVRARRKGLA